MLSYATIVRGIPKKNYRQVLPRLAKHYHDLESLAKK